MLELVADLIKEGADMIERDKVSLYRVLSVAFSVLAFGLGIRHKCVHNLVDLEMHTHIIIYIYMNNMYVCHT